VAVNQLREAFKLAMQGIYGGAGIARLLEASPSHLASDDRPMLDDVLLWTACGRVGLHIVLFEACSAYRGRDAHCWAPPAQIRTGPIRASGSYLGCLTSKRTSGQG
jgi:hypothetical protein